MNISDETIDFLRDLAIALTDGAREAEILGSESIYLPRGTAITTAERLNTLTQLLERISEPN